MQISYKKLFSLLLLFTANLNNPAIAQFDEVVGAGGSGLSAALDSNTAFLPVGEAFVPSMYWNEQDQAQLVWYIEPGYYLYRDRFAYQNELGEAANASYPQGVNVFDEFFQKDLEVFYTQVTTTLEIPAGTETLYVQFQGCAEAGLCYPPSWVGFDLDLDTKSAGFIGALPQGPQPVTAARPARDSDDDGLPLTLILGSLAGLVVLAGAILYISRKSA